MSCSPQRSGPDNVTAWQDAVQQVSYHIEISGAKTHAHCLKESKETDPKIVQARLKKNNCEHFEYC